MKSPSLLGSHSRPDFNLNVVRSGPRSGNRCAPSLPLHPSLPPFLSSISCAPLLPSFSSIFRAASPVLSVTGAAVKAEGRRPSSKARVSPVLIRALRYLLSSNAYPLLSIFSRQCAPPCLRDTFRTNLPTLHLSFLPGENRFEWIFPSTRPGLGRKKREREGIIFIR